MANTGWGKRTIILDTQNDDLTYTAANDAAKTAAAVKYSTQRYCIAGIRVQGDVNTDDILLQECSESAFLTGQAFFEHKSETGNLHPSVTFPGGKWVDGIIPITIDGNSKVYIDIL